MKRTATLLALLMFALGCTSTPSQPCADSFVSVVGAQTRTLVEHPCKYFRILAPPDWTLVEGTNSRQIATFRLLEGTNEVASMSVHPKDQELGLSLGGEDASRILRRKDGTWISDMFWETRCQARFRFSKGKIYHVVVECIHSNQDDKYRSKRYLMDAILDSIEAK